MATLTAETDFALLDRFNSGDDAAFAEIVRRYAGLVYSVCNRVVRDSALAEDVAQETFFKLVQRHDQISSSLAGWLHRSAARLALDALRSESARKRREAAIAAESASATVPATAAVENQRDIRWADLSPVIDDALADLPDPARAILIQHFLQGVSQINLAAEHDVSPATMSRRIQSALSQLRDSLARRGVSASAAALPPVMLFAATSASPPPASMIAALGKMAMAHAAGGTLSLSPAALRPSGLGRTGRSWPQSSNARNALGAGRTGVPVLTLVATVALALLFAIPAIWIQFSTKTDSHVGSERPSIEERRAAVPPPGTMPGDGRSH